MRRFSWLFRKIAVSSNTNPSGLIGMLLAMSPPTPDRLAARLLTAADAAPYVALRREMLLDSPWAFLASPEDDMAADPAGVAARLQEGTNAIAVVEDAQEPGRFIASAGIVRQPHRKAQHRVVIWGVYVTPRARGLGAGRAVMQLAIETARSWPGVAAICLSASERSVDAIRLYKKLGFEPWGVEPDAVRIGSESAAEVHMMLRLG